VGFLALGGLAYTLWRPAADEQPAAPPAVGRFLGFVEAAVVLNAVNLLFFLFVLIQLPYLFGGQLNIGAAGFTYAEYARRGFGELAATSVLVLGLLLALNRAARREGLREARAFNLASTILVALTCVLLASAFKRLLLYEIAYGFTEMRVYPHVFMVWLGLLLGWFVLTLWLRPDRFALGVLIAGLGFVATLDLLNPDAFIVRRNFDRYQRGQGSTLDARYLARLSDDAVPALAQIVDRLPPAERQIVDGRLAALGRQRYQNAEWRRWQAFHLARWEAYRWLAARYDAATLAIPEERSDFYD
jgi:hypothetical protein